MCVRVGVRRELGAGMKAASGAAREYRGERGRRFLTEEEHLRRTHIEGDKGEKTGGG